MLLVRGPDGFTGGRGIDPMVTHLDLYPTLCDVAGIDPPDGLQGRSLVALVQGHTDRLRDEITHHAAHDPQRAIRAERWKYVRILHDYLHPVLPSVDERAAKDAHLAAGWAERSSPASSSTTSSSTPRRATTWPATPRTPWCSPTCATVWRCGCARPTTRC